MSRFRLELGSDLDRARLVFRDRGEVVGVVNISWIAYEALMNEMAQIALKLVRESIQKNLGTALWDDAQRLSEGSVELAKQKLAAMNWTQETIDRYADTLARHVAQAFVGLMPTVT